MNTESNTHMWKVVISVAVLASIMGGIIGAFGVQLLRGSSSQKSSPLPSAPAAAKSSAKPKTARTGQTGSQSGATRAANLRKRLTNTAPIVTEIIKIERAIITLNSRQKEARQRTAQASNELKTQQAASSSLQKQVWGMMIGIVLFFLIGGVVGTVSIRKILKKKTDELETLVKQLQESRTPPKDLQEHISRLENNLAFFNDTLQQTQKQSQQASRTAANTAKVLTKTVAEMHGSLDALHKEFEEGDQHLLKIVKQLKRSLKTFSTRAQEGYSNLENLELEVVDEEDTPQA